MSLSNPQAFCYRLDDTTSTTINLSDGRKLGYAEYGSPTGHPILYCPGFASSRVEAALFDQMASKVNARIISIDRPGFGLSSPHPTRTMKSHAEDVEALASHLKLERYGVFGISGGGPYALACARYLPAERLRAVTLVCGLGSPDMGYWGMKWVNWAGWTFGQRWFPGLCRSWFSRDLMARVDLDDEERMMLLKNSFEKGKAKMNKKDLPFFGDPSFMRVSLQSGRHVFGAGMDAFSLDFKVLSSGFGFDIRDIRKNLPVFLWYGKMDENVPLQHGQKITARLGENAQLKVKDETHVSLSQNWQEGFLAELVAAIQG